MSSRVLVWCGRQLGLSQTSPWRLAVVLRDSTSPLLLRERSVLSRTPNFTFSRCITTSQSRCYSNPQATTSGSKTSQNSSERTGPSPEAIRRAKLFQIATGAACAFFGASYILYRQLKLQASEMMASEEKTEQEEEEPRKKKRVSFHDQRVIGYENRIRAYSTPDKIFRYFATLKIYEKDGSVHIYMTPEDFLRSITPGIIQPEALGLDQFRSVSIERWDKEQSDVVMNPDSVFSRLGHYGLISFSDYLFMLTILATPMRHFEIAFKMFDLNGDGEVDYGEFEKVRSVILNSTAVGARHKDHLVTGNIAGSVGDALVEHFFGPNKDRLLTVDAFQEFHSRLRMDVLKLEFEQYDPEKGRISELNFARLILSQTDLNDQCRKKHFKRIKRTYPAGTGRGISFEEVKAFSKFLDSIGDMEMALSMYLAAGASITSDDLKQVSNTVAGVDLSDHVVQVVFTLFDENNDGELSHKEFIKVMKSRTTRGLEKAKDLGFARLVSAISACSSKTIKDQLGIKK